MKLYPFIHLLCVLTGAAIFFTLLWEAGCLVRRCVTSAMRWGWHWVPAHPTASGWIAFVIACWLFNSWDSRNDPKED